MKLKITLLLILSFSFFNYSSHPVSAQSSLTVQLTAAPGYQGYFKYGEWLPIWIEIENKDRDIVADVRVQITGSSGITTFTTPVSLPSGSRKRFPLYVLPNNFSRELQVDLISKNQSIASQKVSVRPQPNISLFIGLLSPERGALGLLSGLSLPGQERPKVITDLTIAELPDRPEALRSFDIIVINNIDTHQLSPQQVTAIETWIVSGGRLVIGGGPGGMMTTSGLPESILPVNITDLVEVTASELSDLAQFAGSDLIVTAQPIMASESKPVSGYLLSGSPTQPWIYERPIGQGVVDFVAFDLSGIPFNGWPGTLSFWQALIGSSASYPENMPFDMSVRQMRGNQLAYALSNIPSLDLPSIQGLSILLIFYILIVGPLNYLVLRKVKRLHYAWVTIPVLTVLFTAGSFGIGYILRGNDLIMNKIALVELKSGGSASVTTYLGLFSPRQQSYEINVLGEGLVSPMNTSDSYMWGPGGVAVTGSEMIFVQGNPSIVRGLTVNQFSMQSFMSEEIWNGFGTITGDLRLENDVMVGVIRNGSAYKLIDAVITINNRYLRLGDLEPGQEAQVDLGLGNLQTDRFGPSISYTVFQDQMNQAGPNPRAIDQKINILSSVLDNNYWEKLSLSSSRPLTGAGLSSISRNTPVMFFAWLDQAPPDVEIRGIRLAQQATTLVYTPMNYTIARDGPISIPLGMIPGVMTKTPRDGGICGPYRSASVSMGAGEAEFDFQIPTELVRTPIKQFKLNIWRDSGGDWALPEISFLDWQENTWLSIKQPIIGINIIENPAAFVNESGGVKIRLKSESNMYSCYFLDLGLDANNAPGKTGVP